MDKIPPQKRSEVMSQVRSRGNRSTEIRFRLALVRAGIKGWQLHADHLLGCPDFFFAHANLAVFIDGCFWHGCPRCLRMPKQNARYWRQKIAGNVLRDARISRKLSRTGIQVIRIWEHQLMNGENLDRILKPIIKALKKCKNSAENPPISPSVKRSNRQSQLDFLK